MDPAPGRHRLAHGLRSGRDRSGSASCLFVLLQQATGARWCAGHSTARRAHADGDRCGLLLLFLPLALLAGQLALSRDALTATDTAITCPTRRRCGYPSPSCLIRAVVYLAAWWWMARTMSRPVGRSWPWLLSPSRRAAPFLVLLIITASMAAFDWLMALDPHWFSTMFGPYVLAQGLVAALGLLILVTLRDPCGVPHAQVPPHPAAARPRQVVLRDGRLLGLPGLQPVVPHLVRQHPRRDGLDARPLDERLRAHWRACSRASSSSCPLCSSCRRAPSAAAPCCRGLPPSP